MELKNNYRLISSWFRRYVRWNDLQPLGVSGPASFVIVVSEAEEAFKAFLLWAKDSEDAEKQFFEALEIAGVNFLPEWRIDVYPFKQDEVLDLDPSMLRYLTPTR